MRVSSASASTGATAGAGGYLVQVLLVDLNQLIHATYITNNKIVQMHNIGITELNYIKMYENFIIVNN